MMRLVYLKECKVSYTPSGPQITGLQPIFVNLAQVLTIRSVDVGAEEMTELNFMDQQSVLVQESFAEIFDILSEERP